MTNPVINSLSPILGANDTPTAITILGEGFDPSPSVTVGGIDCTSIVRPDPNTINCDVPSGILPDVYDLVVTNTGSETDTLVDVFRVIYPLPALPFVGETQAVILARMLVGLDVDWDVIPGTFVHAVLSAAAFEMSKAYGRADDIVSLFFPQFSRSGYLNLFGESIGLTRDIATKATGAITVNGTNGTIIPVGTKFSTQIVFGQNTSAVEFVSTTAGTISGGSVIVNIEASETGVTGNVSAGQITRISTPISGVTTVSNAADIIEGFNSESDDNYRVRLLNFVQNPIGGGNQQDYITWAFEAGGVDRASSIPLNRGNGTVDIFIVSETPVVAIAATGVLTLTGLPANTQTCVIDTKTYTFQTTLTDVNGNVKIGADAAATIANLVNAMKLGPGSGTAYAASMTLHPTVFGAEGTGDIMDATAKTPGTGGNSIVTTETMDNTDWGGATLSGGVAGDLAPAALLASVQAYIAPVPRDEGGGKAPIGADAIVKEPVSIYVAVTVDITAVSGFTEASVITSVIAAIQKFLNEHDLSEDVKYVDIANVVHDTTGVANYTGLLVNWGIVDIVVDSDEVAIPTIMDVF